MEFRILGPLDVRCDSGHPLVVARRKQRTLLAVLLLRAGEPVSIESLVDYLWNGRAPTSAPANVHSYVAGLRRMLQSSRLSGRERIVTTRGGYLIHADTDELDAVRFERLAGRGRAAFAAGVHDEADEMLRGALRLWRGEVLEDLVMPDALRPHVTRLDEVRLATVEHAIEATLELGRLATAVSELRAFTAEHPLREHQWGQLMLALYRSSRRGEALAAYQEAHRMLDTEIGVEPGPALQRMHQRILVDDPDLDRRPAPGDTEGPHQLPADMPAFTGRAAELSTLDALIPRPGASASVVVVGPPGVGKTTLAVHWAHRVADRFPDGQLYVNLNGYAVSPPDRPVDALARVLRALGVPATQVPTDVQEAAGLFRTVLAGTRTLVVLDNSANAEQVRPLLPGSPTCLVVITSRDRLSGLVVRDGAYRLTIDVLATAEAVALLGQLVDTVRVRATPNDLADLARQCGNLPLALRIAAANLVDRPFQSLRDYLGILAEGRLAALELDGDEPSAVRAAFDLSYASLPAPNRRLFRLMGLAPGPDVDLAAAASLAGEPTPVAASLLHGLTGAHLVGERAPGRYGLHDLLRLYAAERARAEDSEAQRRPAFARYLGYYVAQADAAVRLVHPALLSVPTPPVPPGTATVRFDDPGVAVAWLEAERHNLVAIAQHAVEHGPPPMARHLTTALRVYFYLRRPSSSGQGGGRLTPVQAAAYHPRPPAGAGAQPQHRQPVHRHPGP